MFPSASSIGFRVRFRGFKIALFGLFTVAVSLCGIQLAEGQTLKADYRFQNTRSSTVGASSLTDTGSNTFQSDIVDGITRTVLRFPFNNGLRLSSATSVIPSNSYTIVMLFKVDSVSGFVRLVDFNNRASDNGLYIDSGHLESCTTCNSLPANTFVQVVYTRNSAGTFSGYLNGVLQGQGPDGGVLVIDGSNVLNFFQDDLAAGGEASAGSVARIRLYDAPMTGAQVAALDREPIAATTFSVTNTNDSGLGSLRQAMLDANANVGTDTISFNIAGSGVHTITPLSALPTITGPVIIDGTTQPGFAGTPIIELNGTSAGATANGLAITAGGSTVRGFVINRFNISGIFVSTGGNNTIRGNYIGTDANGTLDQGNAQNGVIISASTNNIVGGTTVADRNVISGNNSNGVLCNANNTNNNTIQGNYIGTNSAGTVAVPNTFSGVNIIGPSTGNIIGGTAAGAGNVISGNTGRGLIIQVVTATSNLVQGNFIGLAADGVTPLGNTGVNGFGIVISNASNNTIGGTAPGARNVISGSDQSGVLIQNASTGNVVQGNFVGTDATGNAGVANKGTAGVFLRLGTNNNTIGGLAAGAGNRIAFNLGAGVFIQDAGGIRNAVLSNAIFSNGRLGINLLAGGNNNFDLGLISPSATSNGTNTTVQSTFVAAANTTYNVQAFANVTCDPSGFGEGQTLLGSVNVTTTGGGVGNLNQVFPTNVPTGQFVTATATDPLNNTSRFSQCVQVNASVMITGSVKNTSNIGISGVTINVTGTQSFSFNVAGSGDYSFGLTPGTYTFTPSKINLSFLPQSVTVSANATVNFTGTTMTSPGGKIVFVSARDGNLEIYSMNPDGSNQSRLTNDVNIDEDPTWSPNGAKIAFETLRTGDFEIFTMNADGSSQTNLTNNPAFDDSASWSPNGSKIAFASDRDGNSEIYVMNADGTSQTRLTNNAGTDEGPAWSSDGTKIAFFSNRDGNDEVYVMNADGSNQVRLTNNTAIDSGPAWSPDGAKIAFHSNRDGNFEVYAMTANGSNQTRLTNNPGSDTFPSYSPDGSQITFSGSRDPQGDSEIYLMNANGSSPTNISNFPFFTDAQSTWQTQAALPAVFRISGRAVDDSGNSVAGISLTLTGAGPFGTTTDGNGSYSFTNLAAGGNYTVTPSTTDYAFAPASQTFNNLSVDRIGNFVGTRSVVTIAGAVTDSNNIGVNNVTVALTKNGTASGTVQTDVLGNYSFANLTTGANYVVTPVGTFTPSSQTLNNLTANATANFKAAPSIPPQCATASFAALTNFPVESQPSSIASGDFNGDGKSDLATANFQSGNVSVLLGTGTGSFGGATTFAVGTNPGSVAIGDFNGDGIGDLAVTNSSSSNVSILLGTGTGSFSAPTNLAVGSLPSSVVIGDFNGDGKSDLAVASIGGHNVSILLGSGTGSFSAATNFAVGSNADFVTIGDFNGDGNADLAVALGTPGSISILLGSGTGSFSAATNFAVGSLPNSVAVGDFNGDGKSDLAVANVNSNNVSILLGSGTGGFSAPTNLAVGSLPNSVAIGDFNGDGKLDLATANQSSNNVSILLGFGTGSFSAATNLAAGTSPYSVAIGDFDGNGKSDLATANSISNNVSILLNNGATCNTQTSLTISGQVLDAHNNPLADVTVTLSGTVTRVVRTDINGNYSFTNLTPGGNYAVTLQSTYFVFAASRADFFNLSSNQTPNFTAAPVAVPTATPPLTDDFNDPTRDASKWNLGTLSLAPAAVDPLVTTAQINGQLVITPLNQASGLHYNGYVSANSFDLTNGTASVELVRAAPGGADTIFAIGSDANNFFRFMVHSAGGSAGPTMYRGVDGVERPLDPIVPQLLLQVMVGGQLTTLPIVYDSTAHHYMRFRHESPVVSPPAGAIVFEASANNIDFTVLHRAVLLKTVDPMTLELSAGTSNPTNSGSAIFDNVQLVLSTLQFSSGAYAVGESDGSVLITVTRTGSTSEAASVHYATSDGTASQANKYITAVGTLSFAAGQTSRTFTVLIVDNAFTEGNEALNLLLSNPTGSGLNSPGRAVLTITDNDTTLATGNPLADPAFFVREQYADFLNRTPDAGGLAFWIDQITSCGTDQACVEVRRINVSAAFFISIEFQETGYLVYRMYEAAYGNLAGTPVPVRYGEFLPDTQQIGQDVVVGQTGWEQVLENNKVAFSEDFVTRSRFTTALPTTMTPAQFVDALYLNAGVTPAATERTSVINEFGSATTTADKAARGRALRRVAENSTLSQQEFNRAFVLMQYFGYLRRNPNDPPDSDFGGYNFWLGKLNQFNGNFVNAEMVKAFLVSGEYLHRFGP